MVPPIRERLGLRQPARSLSAERAERAVAARSLMALFAIGALVAAAALAGEVSPALDHGRIAVTGIAAAAIATALLFTYDETPRWALSVFLLCGSMLIEWAVYASNDPQSPFLVFYLWVAFYGFYFLGRLQAMLQATFIGVAYAVVLAQDSAPTQTQVLRWIVFLLALLVAGLLVRMLRERIDDLLKELSDSSRTDLLTGLLDERGWNAILTKELERARRSGNRVGVVIGQIDGKEPLAAGVGERRAEELLADIGARLGRTIRLNDEAARLGEQFAVICPYTDEKGAAIMAERAGSIVRDAYADEKTPHTLSFGIASYPKHGTSPESLLKSARHALGEARTLSGDRSVTFYSVETSIEERVMGSDDVEIEVLAAETI